MILKRLILPILAFWVGTCDGSPYSRHLDQQNQDIQKPSQVERIQTQDANSYGAGQPMEEEIYEYDYEIEDESEYEDGDDQTIVETVQEDKVYETPNSNGKSQSRKLSDLDQNGEWPLKGIYNSLDNEENFRDGGGISETNLEDSYYGDSGEYGNGDMGYGVEPLGPYPDSDQDLGNGIEPLPTDEHDLGEGIKPLYPGEHEPKIDEESGGGFFSNFYRDIKDKFHGYSNDAKTFFNKTLNKVKEAKERSFEELYYDLNIHLSKIVEKFKAYISSFGEYVQTGSSYVLNRMSTVLSEARCTELILTLEQRLEDGDEEVAKFFQIVGQKVSDWLKEKKVFSKEEHGLEHSVLEHSQHDLSEHFTDPDFPDLFQDPEVHTEMEYLVQKHILKQEEMELLTQQKQH